MEPHGTVKAQAGVAQAGIILPWRGDARVQVPDALLLQQILQPRVQRPAHSSSTCVHPHVHRHFRRPVIGLPRMKAGCVSVSQQLSVLRFIHKIRILLKRHAHSFRKSRRIGRRIFKRNGRLFHIRPIDSGKYGSLRGVCLPDNAGVTLNLRRIHQATFPFLLSFLHIQYS